VFTNSRDGAKIERLRSAAVEIIKLEIGGRDLRAVLQELRERDLQSVLVEGGSEIAGAFIDAGLVDKVTFIYSPIILGGRIAPNAIGGSGAESLAGALKLTDITIRQIGEDVELTGYPNF